jgi:hypothetical protein
MSRTTTHRDDHVDEPGVATPGGSGAGAGTGTGASASADIGLQSGSGVRGFSSYEQFEQQFRRQSKPPTRRSQKPRHITGAAAALLATVMQCSDFAPTQYDRTTLIKRRDRIAKGPDGTRGFAVGRGRPIAGAIAAAAAPGKQTSANDRSKGRGRRRGGGKDKNRETPKRSKTNQLRSMLNMTNANDENKNNGTKSKKSRRDKKTAKNTAQTTTGVASPAAITATEQVSTATAKENALRKILFRGAPGPTPSKPVTAPVKQNNGQSSSGLAGLPKTCVQPPAVFAHLYEQVEQFDEETGEEFIVYQLRSRR